MAGKTREIVFVCVAVKHNDIADHQLHTRTIIANTVEDACIKYEQEFGFQPDEVFGPFYKKKSGMLNKNFDIKFAPKSKLTGTFNDWNITAMPLLNPPDSVYVIYDTKIDGTKTNKPSAMIMKTNEKELQLK